MIRDPTHRFRHMWAAEAWSEQGGGRPMCWTVPRDNQGARQAPATYFNDIASGAHCATNWYEGNNGNLGQQDQIPQFTADDAPALLGFDESIDQYCAETLGSWGGGHAERCVAANLNILSLYGTRVQYNICRNLEWQSCAAMGLVPGQSRETKTIRFAKAPRDLLRPSLMATRLGQCTGWVPTNPPSGGYYGYATDDIFFLEVCLYNEICENAASLWEVGRGEDWRCDFSQKRFRQLQALLLTPAQTPKPGSNRCASAKVIG